MKQGSTALVGRMGRSDAVELVWRRCQERQHQGMASAASVAEKMIERGSWSALLPPVVLFVAADQILHHQIAKERQYLAGQVSGVSGVFWMYSGSHIPGRGLGASE